MIFFREKEGREKHLSTNHFNWSVNDTFSEKKISGNSIWQIDTNHCWFPAAQKTVWALWCCRQSEHILSQMWQNHDFKVWYMNVG